MKRPSTLARVFYLLAAILSGVSVWRWGGVGWEVAAGMGAAILIGIARRNGRKRIELEATQNPKGHAEV